MTIQSYPHLKPQWIHLVWASSQGQSWIPEAKAQVLTQRIKKACRLSGIYLDVISPQPEHLHILARPCDAAGLERLRKLLTQICHRFIQEYLSSFETKQIQFEDWIQPIRVQDLGRFRRQLLRQDQIHTHQNFEQEREDLGLTNSKDRCIDWGQVNGLSS